MHVCKAYHRAPLRTANQVERGGSSAEQGGWPSLVTALNFRLRVSGAQALPLWAQPALPPAGDSGAHGSLSLAFGLVPGGLIVLSCGHAEQGGGAGAAGGYLAHGPAAGWGAGGGAAPAGGRLPRVRRGGGGGRQPAAAGAQPLPSSQPSALKCCGKCLQGLIF